MRYFFLDAPPPTGQWGARRSTKGYNTRHDIFTPWAGINEDLLYAHALATDHTRSVSYTHLTLPTIYSV